MGTSVLDTYLAKGLALVAAVIFGEYA